MKVKKTISKIQFHRLVIFLAIILSAVVFDAFHDKPERLIDVTSHQAESHDIQASNVFFFNSVSSFKLRSGVDKLFSGFVFSASQNSFLTQYHSCRNFHLLKAERLDHRLPFILTANFMKFNCCHHSCPEDSLRAA